MATPTEVREMDDQAIVEHLRDTRRELFGLRFRHATGELENTSGLRATKREIARALTIAHERGLDLEVR